MSHNTQHKACQKTWQLDEIVIHKTKILDLTVYSNFYTYTDKVCTTEHMYYIATYRIAAPKDFMSIILMILMCYIIFTVKSKKI
jgi:hypothetical protein